MKKINKTYIIWGQFVIILFLTAFSVKIYLSLPATSACDNSRRFDVQTKLPGGGMQVDRTTALNLINSFKARMSGSSVTQPNSGTFLSKIVIDKMFENDGNANGLIAYFALNTDGKFNIVFSPVRSAYINPNYTGVTDNIFVSESWCPTVCGIFTQEFCTGGTRCEAPPPHYP